MINTWNHFNGCKWLILNRIIRVIQQYLKRFDCEQTLEILACQQISSNSFKIKIAYKLFTHKSYVIIIIMSRRQHGYPWPSLATSPYHSSPPAGLQGYILCPHIVAVCKFVLVVLLLHIHMWGSTEVHRLWARPCFSSSVPRVWFV